MKRNCNLGLRVSPLSTSLPSINAHQNSMTDTSSVVSQQQITMFYNGRFCVCDKTELQARAIIWLANREMDKRINTTSSNPAPVSLQSQLYSPQGVSLKRSLQRFLQKRTKRSQAASPYNQSS